MLAVYVTLSDENSSLKVHIKQKMENLKHPVMSLALSVFIFSALAYSGSAYMFRETANQEQNADHARLERAIGSVGANGLRAINTLLKGARKYPHESPNPKDLNFVKKGGLFDALQDFYVVSPKYVRSHRTADEISLLGFVGDRMVVLKASKNADAVITVERTPVSMYPEAKRSIITYKRQSKSFAEAPKQLWQ